MGHLTGFNAGNFEPRRDWSPLPAGSYLAQMESSEWKDNRAGTGRHVECWFEVLEGEHRGRQVPAWLNLEHVKSDVIDIALREFAELCRAVSVPEPHDVSDLHEIPLVLDVIVRPRSDNGEPSNRIRSYRAREDVRREERDDGRNDDDTTDDANAAPWSHD